MRHGALAAVAPPADLVEDVAVGSNVGASRKLSAQSAADAGSDASHAQQAGEAVMGSEGGAQDAARRPNVCAYRRAQHPALHRHAVVEREDQGSLRSANGLGGARPSQRHAAAAGVHERERLRLGVGTARVRTGWLKFLTSLWASHLKERVQQRCADRHAEHKKEHHDYQPLFFFRGASSLRGLYRSLRF